MEEQIRDAIERRLKKVTGIRFDDCYMAGAYRILFCDLVRERIEEALRIDGDKNPRVEPESLSQIAEEIGALELESWAVKEEHKSCIGCPAFQWVVHRNGIHPCRLGFMIKENGDKASPNETCLRPQTVGSSYQIARQLGRSEPMVGELEAWQYERYREEKEELGC